MNLRYPRYCELPENLVFIDEIVDLVNEVHAGIPASAKNGKERFTRSMASNYMKQGLTPPAVGKKYAREHICLILLAATLKLVCNAESAVALTKLIFASGDFEKTQDMLAEAFESNMSAMSKRLPNAVDEGGLPQDEDALAGLLASSVAAKVCAHAMTEGLLDLRTDGR